VKNSREADLDPVRESNPAFALSGLDHLVLTVADIDRTIEFYTRSLGMKEITFAGGRHALTFGSMKINLHEAGHELTPHAAHPLPGSADLCLITQARQDAVQRHLTASGIPIEQGPVPRTGALGPVTSTYIRDPDGNLIEISTYDRLQE
jgi:catechol 2,3-dioxygenase-like lactoylglutathione lyase family enzyme